jgi:hypothetical protein
MWERQEIAIVCRCGNPVSGEERERERESSLCCVPADPRALESRPNGFRLAVSTSRAEISRGAGQPGAARAGYRSEH